MFSSVHAASARTIGPPIPAREIKADGCEAPIRAATVRERMPATESDQRSPAQRAPPRGSVWQHGVRQDSCDWRAFGQIRLTSMSRTLPIAAARSAALPPYNEKKMRFSQKPTVIIAASLILPPAGLILLWLRQGTSVFRKSLASLGIVIVGVAHLFYFYGLHMEFSGGIQPVFTFQSGERHYRRLEAHRAALQTPAPAMAEAPPTAPAAPLKAESTALAYGSTYWADFLGPGRLGHYDQKPILTEWPAGGLPQV